MRTLATSVNKSDIEYRLNTRLRPHEHAVMATAAMQLHFDGTSLPPRAPAPYPTACPCRSASSCPACHSRHSRQTGP